ncbi:MAG: hypothetical protein JXK95_06890 [Bacteroidales bacterium]|nr:hypothetical protein [Bacteroidales bacterium]
MKRFIQHIIIWIIVLAYLIVVSGFIKEKHAGQLVNTMNITILDKDQWHFIDENDVREMLDESKISMLGKKCDMIGLKNIEEKLRQQRIIRSAEAYITERGILNIDIRQREPFVRIYNRRGQSYYFDREGNIIPVSRSFSPFVLIVNGHIREPFNTGRTRNIWDSEYDSLSTRQRCIYDVFKLARYIEQDEFWRAQIQQIYVTASGEFELIPRVGSHVIEFGRADAMEEKLYKLKLLYLQGFNKIGWNHYSRINLEYDNQIVCIKN